MCVTWFHIIYCGACKSYIDSSFVGTVFCGLYDAGKVCVKEKSISESPDAGGCATCRPRRIIRRSERLWLRSRNGGETNNYKMATHCNTGGDEDDDENLDEDTSDGSDDENGDDDPGDEDYKGNESKKDGEKCTK
ncbi:hypothetical protein SEUCBS139899_008305 [Sporothrix eucalyptigena]|uniref:Uncharacterized protein n=1 Tax=Sporothrix eucalyptigena TaxID=1812306 RepID=A0ABP0AP29_9PEZI